MYTVKLVDHTNTEIGWRLRLVYEIQKLFDQCTEGSSKHAVVSWDNAVNTDNLVIHFVKDVEHSYIQQKMPGAPLKEFIGGHTRHKSGVSGSEIYKFVGPRDNRHQLTHIEYAKLALHESLHNLHPGWTQDDLHGHRGGGGLAASPPQLPPTNVNKEMIQRGLSIRNPQLL